MPNCGHCTHWAMTDAVPLAFRKGSAAACALGKAWTFIHATKSCARFAPAKDADVRERRVIVRTAREERADAAD